MTTYVVVFSIFPLSYRFRLGGPHREALLARIGKETLPRSKQERLNDALESYAESIKAEFPRSAQEAYDRLSGILREIEEREGLTYDSASGTGNKVLFFYDFPAKDVGSFWIKVDNIHICRLTGHIVALDKDGNMAIYKKVGEQSIGMRIRDFARGDSRVSQLANYGITDRNPNRSFLDPEIAEMA